MRTVYSRTLLLGTALQTLSGRLPAAIRANTMAGLATATALALAGTPALAQDALPAGGTFVQGSGQILQPSPSALDVKQSSLRAIVDWATFSIGDGKEVRIDNANGATLNRVLGGQLSRIQGQLTATGSVYLMNPQGVIVGPGGKVLTGGSFVASTRPIDPVAFMSGGPAAVSGTSSGAIVNQGSIVSQNGSVVMIARNVSNSGTITAKQGRTSMVAADEVLLTTTDGNADNIFVSVRSATGGDVTQTGRIEAAAVALKAAGGNVFALAGNRDGLVQASGTATINGELWLTAPEGKVEVSGQLAAANHDGSGGRVQIQGREVTLTSTAHVSAAGTSGGEVLVGASGFGTGAGLADSTVIEKGAAILAGGPAGGGRIETSGKAMFIGNARIDAGAGGEWLLDPDDITIDTALASTITTTLDGGTNVTQATTAGGTGGVGDITVAAPVAWTGSGALTLDAVRNIAVNQPISGGGSVTLRAAGSTTIASGASVASTADVLVETASFINQAGAGALTAGGRWLVYSGDPANDTTGGLAPDFYQYAAPRGTAPAAGGNGLLYSVAPSVTIALGNVTRSYDGTTVAALDDGNTTVTGLINGDTWTLDGAYANKNVGTGIAVTASNFQATHGGVPVFGYASNAPVTANVGTITAAVLTASIIGNPTKTYNRTTSVTLTPANFQLAGVAAGETVNVLGAATASYDSPNAGARMVNATFTTPNFSAGSGTLLSNYVLPAAATGAGTINPAPLLINGVTANDKVYDGTTAATLNVGGASIFGILAGDTVSLDASGAAGIFATRNVGTEIPVTGAGFTLTGSSAGNYAVSQPTDLVADITPASLVVTGVTGQSKVYDGTFAATVDTSNLVVTGLIPGDDVTTDGTADVRFASRNVGTNIPITVTNVSLGGADAGNYELTFAATLSADITPRPVTLTYTDRPTKVYDGTTNFVASADFVQIDNVVAGESITINQTSGVASASKNVGVWEITGTLRTADFTAGPNTFLSNYILPTSVAVMGEITPAPLNIDIINNPTKPYDGNANATLGPDNFQVIGFVAGEGATVTQTVGQYSSADAGTRTVTADLDASNFAPNANTLMSNYFIPSPVAGPGTITRIPLGPGVVNVDVSGNPAKIYDGNTIATLRPEDYTLTGFLPGEGATITETVGEYALKDAGPRVVVVMLTPDDFLAFPNTNLDNYTLPDQATGIGTILPKPLAATITGNPTRTYNATTRAVVTPANYLIGGVIPGESITVSNNVVAAYDLPNAGPRQVTAQFTADTNFVFGPDTLRSNYVLPTFAEGPGTILRAPLLVLGIGAQNKVYDQTTAATLTGTATLFGVIGSDRVVLEGGSASGAFVTPNAGNNIDVIVAGYDISGDDAANYILSQPSGVFANITRRGLAIANVSALDKLYDGTRTATLDLGSASLTDLLTGDDVTLNTAGSSATFLQKNAGIDLPVNVSGFALTGAQAANYALSQPSGLTADINPVVLTGAIIGNPSKTYDGTTSVSLTAANFSLTGFIPGEGGRIAQAASAAYDSPDAGARTITATEVVSDIVANSGTLLSNYVLPNTVSGPGTITQAMLTASIINNPTKVYDATTAATLTGANFLLQGFVAGESATVTRTAGLYDSKNVGSRNVTATLGTGDFAAGGGTNLANYMLPASATGLGTITPATAQVINVEANDKVYDGTTVATLDSSVAALSGIFDGDVVNVGSAGATGTFATKNVGTGIAVAATGYTISGADAGNYTLLQPTGLAADITQATIAITSVTKVYDSTTAVPTVNSAYTLAPVFGSDSVQVNAAGITGNYDTKNVGTGKAVTLAGVALTGADAGNYVISPTTTGAPIGTITPAALNVIGAVALDKVYDQNTVAQLDNTGTALSGVFAGDIVNLSMAATGNFNNANAGVNKPVTTTGYSISGLDAPNYTLVQPQGLTATILRRLINLASVVKVYDGTTALPLASSAYSFSGILSGDVVNANASAAAGGYASKDVGGSISGGVVTGGIDINVSGLTLTGAQGGNYVVADAINVPIGVITPRQLTAAIIGNPTKTYDALDTAALTPASFQITGFVPSEGATVTQTAGTYDSINAGSRIVTASLAASDFTANPDTLLSNYILPTSASGAGTINRAVLTISGVVALDKVYDGATLAGLDSSLAVLNGIVPAEPLTITLNTGGATGQFAQANAGTDIPVTASGYTINGDVNNNYILTQPTGLFADITQALLTLTRVTKIYDGTLALPTVNSAYTLSGIVGSDAVALDAAAITGGGYATKDVATGIAVDITGLSLTGAASGNYSIASSLTAAPIGQITPATLTAAIINNPTKVYDATTAATLAPPNFQLTGFVAGEGADVTQIAGTYDSANAGPRTVTASLAAGNFTATGGTLLSNYILPTTASGAGTINRADLTAAIINNPTKVYDGNATATLAPGNFQLTGFAGGQGATVTQTTGAYDGVNAGPHQVTASLSAGNFTANSGTLLSNYNLPVSASGLGTINPATLTAIIVGNPTKTYDGNTVAALAGANYQINGFVAGEGANVTQTVGSYDSANAGPRTVTASLAAGNFTATGSTLLSNYILPTTASGAGTINPAALMAVIVGNPTKTYDGNTTATLTSANYQITGFIGGDGATVSQTTGVYDSANTGSRTVTASLTPGHFTGTGSTLLSNYVLPASASGAGTIDPATLTAIIVGNPAKAYDGNTTATLTPLNFQITGFAPGESASVTQTVGTYDDRNAGARTVSASLASTDFTAGSNTNLGNYVLPESATGPGTILRAVIFADVIGLPTKDYDGTDIATLTPANFALGGFAPGEGATVTQTVGTYASAHTGNHRIDVTLDTGDFVADTGTLLSNYDLPTQAFGFGFINRLALSAAIIGNPTKIYDGTDAATLASANFALTGFIAGESGTVTETTGTYDSPNAGPRNVTAALGSPDFVAGPSTDLTNYILPASATGTGTIDPATLTAIITGNPAKSYDGTTMANLAPANFQISGFVTGEGATVTRTTGSYDDPNAGPRTVTASLTAGDFAANSGTLLSNYVLPTSASGAGTITAAMLTATLIDVTKVYDGTTAALLAPPNYVLTGLFGSDSITITETAGLYASPNAGSHAVTAALDSGDFTANGSTVLSNYVLPPEATGIGVITPAPLTVSIIGNPIKTYDGTGIATLTSANYRLTGFVAGEGASVTRTAGTYDSANAGARTVTADLAATDYSATGGTLLSNYILPVTASGAGTINRADLTAIITGNPARPYDGTTVATLTSANYQIDGFVAGEGATVTQTVGAYDSANAGARTVTANLSSGDFTATGGTLLSNYNLPLNASGAGTIDRATLTAIITGNPAKTYDGTTAALLSPVNYQITGFAPGEGASVSQAVGTYDRPNAGPRTVSASLAATDYTATGGTLLSNYVLPVTASGAGTINRADLAIGIIGNPTKVYDGTTAAALTGANYELTGFIQGEGATVTQTAGTYDSANAGSRTVTASLAASDYAAAEGTLLSNYNLPTMMSGTGTINRAALTAAITGNPTKYFDGTTDATLTPAMFTITGFAAGEGAIITRTHGLYSLSTPGVHDVTADLTEGDFTADTGTLLSNYILPVSASGPGTILTLPEVPDSLARTFGNPRFYIPYPVIDPIYLGRTNAFAGLPSIIVPWKTTRVRGQIHFQSGDPTVNSTEQILLQGHRNTQGFLRIELPDTVAFEAQP